MLVRGAHPTSCEPLWGIEYQCWCAVRTLLLLEDVVIRDRSQQTLLGGDRQLLIEGRSLHSLPQQPIRFIRFTRPLLTQPLELTTTSVYKQAFRPVLRRYYQRAIASTKH